MYLYCKQCKQWLWCCRSQQMGAWWRRPRSPVVPHQRSSASLSPMPCRLVEWSVCATDTRRGDQSISRFVQSYHDHGGHSYLVRLSDMISEDIIESINMGPSIDRVSIELWAVITIDCCVPTRVEVFFFYWSWSSSGLQGNIGTGFFWYFEWF